MKIVFIHGMNQQPFNVSSLQTYWLEIFKLGLKNSKLTTDISKLHCELAFYGDLLSKYGMSNVLDLETLLPHSFSHWHLPFYHQPQQIQPAHKPPILPLLSGTAVHDLSFLQRLNLTREMIADWVLKELMLLLNRFPKFNETIIQKFLVETYLYLSNPEFMQEVHQRILQSFVQHEDMLIVAHSLGTVIAYNLLHRLPAQQYSVRRFVTLGSPMAFKVIQSRLPQPIQRPHCLQGDWYNFYSSEDFLTAFPLSAPPFDFTPPIINREIRTFSQAPHQISGYLQHPDVVRCIMQPVLKRRSIS